MLDERDGKLRGDRVDAGITVQPNERDRPRAKRDCLWSAVGGYLGAHRPDQLEGESGRFTYETLKAISAELSHLAVARRAYRSGAGTVTQQSQFADNGTALELSDHDLRWLLDDDFETPGTYEIRPIGRIT